MIRANLYQRLSMLKVFKKANSINFCFHSTYKAQAASCYSINFGGLEFSVKAPKPKSVQAIQMPKQLAGPSEKNATAAIEKKLIAAYDPNGLRQKMMQKNTQGLRVGAVVIVESFVSLKDKTNMHQFAGFVTDIRRRGVDTSITLRNRVTKLGVELKIPVFSPLIRSLRILSPRGLKKVRRARLNYLRTQNKGDVSAWVDAERIYYERLRKAKNKK